MNEIEICLQCTLDDCRPQSDKCGIRMVQIEQGIIKPRPKRWRRFGDPPGKIRIGEDRREYWRQYYNAKRRNQPKPTEVNECKNTPQTITSKANAENVRPQNDGQ